MLKFLLELDICSGRGPEWRCFCVRWSLKGMLGFGGCGRDNFCEMFDLFNIMVKRTRFKNKMSQSNNNLRKIRSRLLNCSIGATLG